MPLLHFHVVEGRSESDIKAMLDAAHEAMLETFEVPRGDRYQIVSEHKKTHLVVEDTGLDIPRTDKILLLQMFTRPRGDKKNEEFYKNLTDRLQRSCNMAPSDVMISVVENNDAHWSFGHGRAQFLTGEL